MAKTLYEHHIIDSETGEIKSTTWVRNKKLTQESFIRTYIQDIGVLAKCSGSEISTVLCCLKYMDWDTNEIVLNAERRHEICLCGDLKLNTVNCAISRLTKKNIFIKNGKKLLLNPTLFFFGSDLGRSKVFELRLQYHVTEE